jgi:putative ABC transport system permease protein
VGRIGQAGVLTGGPAEQAVDLLVIDPTTFSGAAFWDGHFSGTALPEILDRLSRTTTLRLPAVGVGLNLGDRAVLRLTGTNVPVASVATGTAFPGMREGRPLVVVARSTLLRAAPGAAAAIKGGREVWAAGDPTTALAALRRAGIPTASAVTAERLTRTPAFLAVSWTFSFLEALGLVAGLVVLVGLVLYLQSRQESRDVAYALARRMGLSAGSHRRSVAMELAGMLLGAFVVGAGLAAAATRLIYRKLDLLPGQPPAPLYRIPASALGGIALALALVAVVGAAAVQRRADRANVGEVMRLAA